MYEIMISAIDAKPYFSRTHKATSAASSSNRSRRISETPSFQPLNDQSTQTKLERLLETLPLEHEQRKNVENVL